ncbi:protein-tyrosine phosphatase [Campylobacter jejuni]|nr:protein-tyrosine phosphatase [Campylobacter jejuni]
MFNSVLIVCIGNVCRSPIAEAMLQQLLPAKAIHSAGISALAGDGADAMASRISEQHGFSLQNHKARQLTREMCHDSDLILIMEKAHISSVSYFLPEVRGKTMLLGYWNQKIDIPDPYGKSADAFEYAFSLIKESVIGWKSVLERQVKHDW